MIDPRLVLENIAPLERRRPRLSEPGAFRPAIPYEVRDLVRYPDEGTAREILETLSRRTVRADEALRAQIAILYPPLPVGYVWERQMTAADYDFVNGGATFRIRYRPRHIDDLNIGARYWRP